MYHLVSNNIVNIRQHGFVKNKACVSNLLETLDYLTKCLSANVPVDVAFIDFLKAFDLVVHKIIIYKLSKYGISACLLQWIA